MKAYNLKQVMRKAHELRRAGVPTFSEALRQSWKLAKALLKGSLTFWKMPKTTEAEAEITTRRIASLEAMNFQSKGTGTSRPDIAKFVDLDKYAATGNLYASLISCHPFQIL